MTPPSYFESVVRAWDEAPVEAINPLREYVSEDAYWASGRRLAGLLDGTLLPGSEVLDFGCGDGRVAVALDAAGYRVVCADASPAMLERAAARLPRAPQVLTAGTTPFPGVEVDAAICISVLIHHRYHDQKIILRNLVAAVRAGGLLVLDWPVSASPVEGETWISVTTWSWQAQNRLAAELGMKRVRTIEATDVTPPLYAFRVG